MFILYLSVEPGDEGDGCEEELAEGRVGVEEEDALQVEGGVLSCNKNDVQFLIIV